MTIWLFEQVAIAMFGYMTEIDKVEMLEKESIEAEGEYKRTYSRPYPPL